MQSQFPLRPITNAALEGKGSFETIGFKRRFLHTFVAVDKSMPPEANKKLLLGKVGRRRHGPYKKKSTCRNEKKKTCKEGTDSHDQPADWSRNDGFSI